MPNASIYAGTSGFSYASWKPDFYPKEIPTAKFLSFYATRLNLVEVNFTFRRLGSESIFRNWINQTPEGFVFSPKAHNTITHTKRLKEATEFTRTFLDSLDPFRLANRLGPILFQLPPNLKADTGLLHEFVRLLPKRDRYAFEFRNASWFSEEIYSVLRDHNICLCLAENENLETPQVFTADFAYYRFRKPEYTDAEIEETARRLARHRADGHDVYALFKHEESPAGALYAERLRSSTEAASSSTEHELDYSKLKAEFPGLSRQSGQHGRKCRTGRQCGVMQAQQNKACSSNP